MGIQYHPRVVEVFPSADALALTFHTEISAPKRAVMPEWKKRLRAMQRGTGSGRSAATA